LWENWPKESTNKSPDVLLVKQRIANNQFQDVYLKVVGRRSQEIQIIRYLTSPELRTFSTLACPPVLTIIEPSSLPTSAVFTTPSLVPLSMLQLQSVSDCLDLVRQALEGLAFLHSHRIAHLDLGIKNIMIVPAGLAVSHPQYHLRQARPVQYCFIDFGMSVQFDADQTRLHRDGSGRSITAPEVHEFRKAPHGPGYDPFPVDIWCLGEEIKMELLIFKVNLRFLLPLVRQMTEENPLERPTADQALQIFQKAVSQLKRRELKKTTIKPRS